MSEANKRLVRRHFEETFNRHNFAVCGETIRVVYRARGSTGGLCVARGLCT